MRRLIPFAFLLLVALPALASDYFPPRGQWERVDPAEAGFDPVYGARPLKRYLQQELETRLGRALIAGEILEGSRVLVGANDEGLTIEVRSKSEGEVEAGTAAG